VRLVLKPLTPSIPPPPPPPPLHPTRCKQTASCRVVPGRRQGGGRRWCSAAGQCAKKAAGKEQMVVGFGAGGAPPACPVPCKGPRARARAPCSQHGGSCLPLRGRDFLLINNKPGWGERMERERGVGALCMKIVLHFYTDLFSSPPPWPPARDAMDLGVLGCPSKLPAAPNRGPYPRPRFFPPA
jgi:hypothetical protein